jgi:hypothetical protein
VQIFLSNTFQNLTHLLRTSLDRMLPYGLDLVDQQPGQDSAAAAQEYFMYSSDFSYAYSQREELFLPNPATCCLQYMYCLSLSAGLHPVLVGGAGSGKRSLVRHALACWQPFGSTK